MAHNYADNALTTVAQAEAIIGETTVDTIYLVNAASEICEQYAGRKFYRDTAIVEKVPADASSPVITVARPPINSITSIVYGSATIDSSSYEIRDSDGRLGHIYSINSTWTPTTLSMMDIGRTIVPGYERYYYTVTYDGGWYTAKQDDVDGSGTRNLPYDIEQACIAIVGWLNHNITRDPSVVSESLLGSSVTYHGQANGGGWLRHNVPLAAAILDTYKKGMLL